MPKAPTFARSVIAVLGGGFCGTTVRYLLGLLIQEYLGKGWPYDILLINISGAFLLALVTTLAEAAFLVGPTRRLFINVGFLGAYTTFSSMALGDDLLLGSGQALLALLYFLASLFGGLLAVMVGSWLGQLLLYKTRPALAPGLLPLDFAAREKEEESELPTEAG